MSKRNFSVIYTKICETIKNAPKHLKITKYIRIYIINSFKGQINVM